MSGSWLPQTLAALATHRRLADGVAARQALAADGADEAAEGNRRVDVTEFIAWCRACGVAPTTGFARLLRRLR